MIFDEGCVKSWLTETTNKLISLYAMEETQKMADEQRRAFKPIVGDPRYSDFTFISEKFGEKARQEALKILEAERKAFVEARAESIKNTLTIVIRQLKFLVFTDKGKGKIYIRKVPIEGKVGQNAPSEREVSYFESYPEGIEHLERIGRVLNCFAELNDYVPYMNEELTALYQQARDLASLERVWEKKDAKT